MTPGRALYVIALATLLSLALVRQSAALREAGYRLEGLRRQVAEEQAEHAIHQAHLSKLKSPGRILGLVRWLGLDICERAVAQAEPGTQPPDGKTVTTAPERPVDVSVAQVTDP